MKLHDCSDILFGLKDSEAIFGQNAVSTSNYCFKGGGGGGGSGVVDYPAYMKNFHNDLLNHTGVDTVTSSIVDIMNIAIGNSPYTLATAYDPDVPIAAMLAEVNDFNTLVDLLSSGTGLDTLVSNILSQSRIDDAVDEYSLDLGNRLTVEVLPRFEAGMRDINAVVSSAFAIGRAVIEDGQTRQVAKYSADLHMKAFGDDALQLVALKLEFQKNLTHVTAEANRLKIVAKKEEADVNLEVDEADALWDIELFQHGANLLASIGGGVAGTKKKSTASSVIGGAITGAVAGGMIATGTAMGGPVGAVVGGVLGAAAGFLD
jgi:hypothetical protein